LSTTISDTQGWFSQLTENMRDAFVSVNMQGVIQECNNEYRSMLGYDADEILTMTYQQITPAKWHVFEELIIQNQVLVRGYSDVYEKEYQRKDGSVFPIELRTILVRDENDQPVLMWAIIRDISERKQAEQALKASRKMNADILNAMSASIFLVEPDGTILAVNEMGASRLKTTEAALVGKCAFDLFPPAVAESRKKAMQQVCRSGEAYHYNDERQGIWFENSIHPLVDENGRVSRLAIIASDVTEKLGMIEALQASEERYRGLAETAQDSIYIVSKDDTVLYVNEFAARWLGMPAAQIVGRKRTDLFPGGLGQRQYKHILNTIRSGKAGIFDAPSHAQGKTYWLSTRLVPLKDSAGEFYAVLGVSRDITDRVKAEKALLRARNNLEKRVVRRTAELEATQASLRRLANQIVMAQEEERRRVSRELHDDASQLLVSLRYSLAALLDNIPGQHDDLAASRIESALNMVDSITEHIRTLGHSLRPPALDVGGIHLCLKDTCREFTDLTHIKVDYQGVDIPGLPQEVAISLYRVVQEALTNVLKHAYAMHVKVRLLRTKHEINLTISDDGVGLSESGASKGIGLLGLEERMALVGGSLTIRSKPGSGAILSARVPMSTLAGELPAGEQK
jgi:PAS domain S-box-containing protein